MPKDLSHPLSQGNYETENTSCFDAKNEWGTNYVTVQRSTRSSAPQKSGKNTNKKRAPKAGSTPLSLARAYSLEGRPYLLTLSHPTLWAPLGSGIPVAQTMKKIRRRLGKSITYRWQKAYSRHHGEHAHIAVLYSGNRKNLISAIEAGTGVPREHSFKKNTLAHSVDGIWHIREKAWDEACSYLDAQDEKHGIKSEDRRRRGSSRNAPTTTQHQLLRPQDEALMQIAGIFLTAPKDAAATYPDLGTAAALKKRWARKPLQQPEGYNRLTYRRPRGRNSVAYISPAIRNPTALLARILPGVSITSFSLRHRETTSVPIWAAVERREEEAKNRPVESDKAIRPPSPTKTLNGRSGALLEASAAILEAAAQPAA